MCFFKRGISRERIKKEEEEREKKRIEKENEDERATLAQHTELEEANNVNIRRWETHAELKETTNVFIRRRETVQARNSDLNQLDEMQRKLQKKLHNAVAKCERAVRRTWPNFREGSSDDMAVVKEQFRNVIDAHESAAQDLQTRGQEFVEEEVKKLCEVFVARVNEDNMKGFLVHLYDTFE